MKSCTNDIIAVSSEIGRGHPNYLDGLLAVLRAKTKKPIPCYSVFDLSNMASKKTWHLVAYLYKFGAQGGTRTVLYNWLRSRKNENRKLLALLGRDLRHFLNGRQGNVLVEHPVLARILADICPVYYIHGEIAVPASSAVSSTVRIFVPLEKTKDKFVRWGVKPERVSVTGLMIEPGLADRALDTFNQRLKRIKSNQPLLIGLFASGAYPYEHMKKIVAATNSIVSKGHKAIVFAGTDKSKLGWIKRNLAVKGVTTDCGLDNSLQAGGSPARLVSRANRIDDTKHACELLPELDAFVAAAHERTNWALGLGLPMFVLFPMIGPFAPENFLFAKKQGVVYALDTDEKARRFGDIVVNMRRDGILSSMAKNGFGKYSLDGCEKAAEEILDATRNEFGAKL